MSNPSHVDRGLSSPAPLSAAPAAAVDQPPCDPPSRPHPLAAAPVPATADHEAPGGPATAPAEGGAADHAARPAAPTPSATATSTAAHASASHGTPAPPRPPAPIPSVPAQSQSGPAVVPQGRQASDMPLSPPGTETGASADPTPSLYTKGPRPSALDQRQQGSSLLTQALATARGIPPQAPAGPSAAPSSTASSTYTGPQTTTGGATSRVPPADGSRLPYRTANSSTTPHRTDTAHSTSAPSPFKNDGSRPDDAVGGSLTPETTAASTVAAPTPATLTSPDLDPLSSHAMSAVVATYPVPAQHPSSPSAPSPFERIERDVRALERQRRSRAYSQSHNPDQPLAPTVAGSPEKVRPPVPCAPAPIEEEQQPDRPGTEPRYSIGPEKMWSIGSGELDDAQDGHVEKSIAKAMTKEEPNNRSRKASHTLGFFREGLPEEKGRRKGSKGAGQARPGPTAEWASRVGASSDVISEEPRPLAEPQQPPVRGPEKEVPPAVSRPPPDTPAWPGEPADKASAGGARQRPTPAPFQPPSPACSSAESLRDVGDKDTADRPAGSQGRASHDEGDESGEEKISSAFFLPHQDPERAVVEQRIASDECEPVTGHAPPRAQDRSPWLVKAGEPEPEDHTPPPTPPASQSGGGRRPSFGASRDTTMVCEEIAIVDEPDRTLPSSAKTVSHPTLLYHDNYHAQEGDQKAAAKQPLEAIELIPYNHQVGGHTPLWRFSKRAVCKKLNNRENEFYETVEHFHRDLLPFLPRYIGVLNVTFHKLPRRKSTTRKDDAGSGEGTLSELTASKSPFEAADGPADQARQGADRKRVVSQSFSNGPAQIPTVTFDDNRHIIPRNLLQPDLPPVPPVYHRARKASGLDSGDLNGDSPAWTTQGHPGPNARIKSWGATIVNKRLRNEVFNNAFFEHPVSIQRHRKPHRRPLVPRPAAPNQPPLKTAQSDSRLLGLENPVAEKAPDSAVEASAPIQVPSRAHLSDRPNQLLPDVHGHENGDGIKDVAGTSAPEPETLGEELLSQKRTRRYSGSGLRRKPQVGSESRGNLKFFEEADQVLFQGDKGPSTPFTSSNATEPVRPADDLAALDEHAAADKFALPPPVDFKIPRPVNPKEAQTQRDPRVEYFLLLEDLTAGMRRPCIMDLKMGTRQYGVDATPAKRESQKGKCAKTTSRELGVRVCGLQVWDAASRSYIFRDKYEGRRIAAGAEFQEALTRFLYNGVDAHSVLRQIPTILRKLDELARIARGLRGYRFYAASLLMFYDGEDAEAEGLDEETTDGATDAEDVVPRRRRRNKREVDFKIADFANSITARTRVADKACPPRYPEEPDRGFLRGLATLRGYFLKIQRDVRAEVGIEARGRVEDVLEEEEGFVSE